MSSAEKHTITRFIIKMVAFLLPLAIAFTFIEYKLGHIPNTYNTKKNCLNNKSDSVEVLVLGTSHSLFGINPQYFSHVGFNLANASQSLDYDEQLTLKFLPTLPKLKLVMIAIGYQTLYFRLANTDEYWRGFYYRSFMGLDNVSLPYMDSRRFSLLMLYTPQVALDIMRKGFKINYAEKLLCNGYMYPDVAANAISDSTAAYRVHMHNMLIKSGKHKIMLSDLDTFVKVLRAKNIQVVFITLPVYTTYSSKCDPITLSKNEVEINNLCTKYNCIYNNYFTDTRFTIEDFNDNDHLNIQGANKFSAILDTEVIQKKLGNN